MMGIKDWCKTTSTKVGAHDLTVLELDAGRFEEAGDAVAKAVPSHYASDDRVAGILKRLGKKAAAKFVKEKLPDSKKIRSGDLGEILGSTYVNETTSYDTGVNKLRWKDHREMAMRGDDLIAFEPVDGPDKIRFLKGEVKSAKTMTGAILGKARTALKKSYSRPSPHALQFIADRLHDEGEDVLADLIDDAVLLDRMKLSQVSHMIFTFSGNDASALLSANVKAYTGKVAQSVVGLRIKEHQEFIASVYGKVVKNADGK
ncbi:DUF1837 domain-containing protein [Mesorhizobium sp. AD1-1]|uniref:Hachiman antiphage defense system protein HamA n=1 Tax=Mesorhizobium sp. AD1-1 TaxID=2876621 RepID=UPI001CCE8B87|nr:Hachiman antiphage defense system protein HamA [Mesorhizobium sp. AD1-1]MBZ9717839.1 DUF1837 domain-containing protein [Mesorhizobium sp. AD1-1]